MRKLTPEQRRAVERRDGSLLVRAGAGTGKTTVLVERFVEAVTKDGAEVDQVLAITFTEKAAAEMKSRVRRRFLELDRREDARAAESAWVSTIHALCARILRAHALSAGVDPAFRVLDELDAERIAADAFDGALEEFMGEGDSDRIEMVAAYTPDRLRDMVRTAYSHLRSRGERRPRLEETLPPQPSGEADRLEAAALAALAELAVAPSGVTVDRAIVSIEARSEMKGKAKALESDTCEEYRDALAAFRTLEVAEREHRDHTMLRVLLELYGERYARAKRERSALDFEDLELVARDLLRRDEGLREAYSSRFEHVLVDEFQDTNRLQNQLLGLLSRENLFRVGDENQSIYRFRNADVSVFREHWQEAQAAGRAESITVNFRSRGEVLDAIDLAFERAWGESFEALREAPGSRKPAAPVAALRGPPRGGQGAGRLEGDDGAGRPVRGSATRRAAVARGRGAPAGEAGRRAHPRGALVLRRRRDVVSRDHGDGPVRARARRAWDPRSRGRRARLLGPAAGGRPAPLAGRAGESARRAGALLGARLAARGPVARRRCADSAACAPFALGSVEDGARAHRRARRRAARARPAAAARVRRAVRGRAPHRRPGVTRDADRPRGYAHRLRPSPAGASRRHTPNGERAQADADGAAVRGGRGPRPAWVHRRGCGPRRDPGARGGGAARGRVTRRRADDDRASGQGPRVPGGLPRGPGQGRPGGRRAAAYLG